VDAPSAWGARVWQVDDGLPDNRIVGLVQSADGYLWVGTREGLVRFNGTRFEAISLARARGVAGAGLRSMLADSHGNLWLDTFRETVVRLGPAALQVFTSGDGVPPGECAALAEDAAGRTWLSVGGRLCVFAGGRFQPTSLSGGSLARDGRGQVWCASPSEVGVLDGGRFVPRFPLGPRPIVLAPARAGGLWICAGSQLLRLAESGRPEVRFQLAAGASPTCLLEDQGGAVWVGTAAHGVWRCAGLQAAPVETSHRNIDSLLEDREGNLWVGTVGGGLNRVRPRPIEVLGVAAGQSFASLVSACEDSDGQLWVAAADGTLAREEGRTLAPWPAGERWSGGPATCVAADQAGNVWVGTRGQGLHQIGVRDGRVRTWSRADGLPGLSLRGLFVAADGAVWLATNEPATLCRLKDGAVQVLAAPPGVRTFRAITQDVRGDLWIGTSEGRVLKVVGAELRAEPLVDGAGLTSVRCLHAAPDGSLWIGDASQGIVWLRGGRLTRFSTATGLVSNSIWQIAGDRGGALWIASPPGLSRVTPEDARAVAAGSQPRLHPTLYGREEGLRNFQAHYGNLPAVCQRRDGRILFATSQGLLVLNPAGIRDNPLPPPVLLERVTSDDRVVASSGTGFAPLTEVPTDLITIRAAGAHLRLPPENRRLAFEFAVLSFAAPENVRVRYRLEGWDDGWTETGGERTVRYARLPAGGYTFRVTASNRPGEWAQPGAALAITVSPFFWQTWWFRLGLLGAFTGAVAVVVRLVSHRRLRRQLRRAEQLSALAQERARIARDIHDDLGGSLTHIKLLSELAERDRAQGDRSEDYLGQITSTTRQMLKSLDEIVWAINPRNDSLPNLIGYLGQYAVEFLRAAGLRCQIDLPDNPPEIAIRSDVRHNLFLVLKEALTNAARHAQATTVRVQARLDGNSLEIGVEDDGRGMDLAAAETRGDGLSNMRQRMTAAGGVLRLESGPGAGTKLRLRVALRSSALEG
jgi:signal transduction histidine kinase/ligand-binding sensor domain-containing protein